MTDRTSIAAVLRWGAFVLYLALTFYLSSRSQVPGTSYVPDYVLHALEFSFMALLLIRALSGGIVRPHTASVIWTTVAFGGIYGALDELHQSFVPGRDCSVRDASVDAAATALTVLAVAAIGRRTASERT